MTVGGILSRVTVRHLFAPGLVTLSACSIGVGEDDTSATVGAPAIEASGPLVASAPPRPNILLILADDLGVNDISLNQLRGPGTPPPPIDTPHIDSIGRGGLMLTQAFTTHATCAPSRAALMTGRYQHRFGFEFNPGASGRLAQILASRTYLGIPGRYFPERLSEPVDPRTTGLPADEITIAEVLRGSGYRTAHFGKWHLGGAPQFRPENQGFDLSVGFYQGASRYAPAGTPDIIDAPLPIDEPLWDLFTYSVVRNGHPVETTQYQTDLWADEAIRFMTSGQDEPFFAYVAFNAPHNPLQAPKAIYDELDHIADHEERVYYAMIVALDGAIGRMLAALEENGLAEDTLVVFASDNGGAEYTHIWTHNLPLRGYKGTFWEGGIRTPLFVRWPGVVRSGGHFAGQASLMDLFATFAGLAGATMPRDRTYDSVDLWPYLDGRKQGPPHRLLYWKSGDYRAVRGTEFKYKSVPRPEPGGQWLYESAARMPERENLAGERPELVERYRNLLTRHFGQMPPPRWNVAFELPVRADPPADSGDPLAGDPVYVYVSGG